MIDLHAHILPGLDDGPGDAAESLRMCRAAAGDGISAIAATPHMFDGVHTVTRDQVLRGVADLNALLAAEEIPIEVLPGADTHVAVDLPRLVRSGEIVTLGDRGRYLLLELPHDVIPAHLDELLFELRLAGIVAVLTHPERHMALQSDPAPLEEYAAAGHLVQVTACSLTGHFGEAAYACAAHLVEAGLCHIVASDCHSLARRPPLLSPARKVVAELAGPDAAALLFDANPVKLLEGQPVTAPAAARRTRAARPAWLRRIWS